MGAVSTISSKGQITVPVEVRRRLGIHEGDKVEFVFEGERTILKPVREGESPFSKWLGVASGEFKDLNDINHWVSDMRGDDREEG